MFSFRFFTHLFKKPIVVVPEPVVEPEPEPEPLHGCGHRSKSSVFVFEEHQSICLKCYNASHRIPRHQFSVK